MKSSVYALVSLAFLTLFSSGCATFGVRTARPQVMAPRQMTLSAAGAMAVVDSTTGCVTSLRLGQAREEMCQAHPAGGDQPFGFVEVLDQRTGRIYNPIYTPGTITSWHTMGKIDGTEVAFTEHYAGAPFEVRHLLKETKAGIRWEVAVSLLTEEARKHTIRRGSPEDRSAVDPQHLDRSVQVAWVLPVPAGWQFWGPNDVVAHPTDAVTPYRYVYGHTDYSAYSTLIPLVGVWGRQSGAAIFSPPDVRKCQIMFDLAAPYITDMPQGGLRHAEDMQMLWVRHDMVGLRPGRPLRLAICIAGTRPDWRSVMGHYVDAYPDLFEPVPQTRKYEGLHHTSYAAWFDAKDLGKYHEEGVTSAELHAHFPRYGEYVPPGAIENPDKTWTSAPSGSNTPLSVAKNRQTIKQLKDAGVAPFLYFYNVHAQPSLVAEKFQDDVMHGEDGRVNIQFEGEPALRAQPDSPFGRHLLEQLGLLLKAYPEAPGVFMDNFAVQWVDFAHDDSVTMVHDLPAYDLNRNHQDLGTMCMTRIHEAGKVVMVNKMATIESGHGVDMVLLEKMTVPMLKTCALACAYRPLFPTEQGASLSPEKRMQQLLIWGGLPAESLPAYRPLTNALIGKRWVFDPDPLTLPRNYDGQIFRIDEHAPYAGDVVVTVVNLQLSYKDRQYTEGLSVSIRLPEIDEFHKATWMAAERPDQKPEPCQFDRDGEAMIVHLPLVGAAGVLRLSR